MAFGGKKPLSNVRLFILVTFYKYHTRTGGRRTRPTLRELVQELGGDISVPGVVNHLYPLVVDGYLEKGPINAARSYYLTPKGVERAKRRIKVLKRAEKRQAAATKERRRLRKLHDLKKLGRKTLYRRW